jgi:hypothetical protein
MSNLVDTQPMLAQKLASGATYVTGGGLVIGDVMNYLGDNSGAFGVILGALTFLTNWYYQHKRDREG